MSFRTGWGLLNVLVFKLLVVFVLVIFVGLLIVLNPAASSAQTFFQGFEVDTSDWFPLLPAIVNRSQSLSSSSSYNSGTTSVYASGIPAATGDFDGRVKSKISTSANPFKGSCTLESAGGGQTLRCSGPYTDWGLGFANVQGFPSGGYSTQLDIYLDDTYAMHHPDCGQQGPCTPDTPGTLNPECATNPNGINCEGSRFDWDIGVDDPSGGFLQDYAFNVGTAPDPHGVIEGCTQGWVIAASTNSFRSGASPYNLGKDPKCLSGTGWYTFQHELMDDGSGFLKVYMSVLDLNGDPAACTDENGDKSTCEWTLYPGHKIEDVGCTEYGWLANEEINDLPIDNTWMTGCGKAQPTISTTLSEIVGITGDIIYDTAMLAGATPDAGGTVSYTVYSDSGCTIPADVGAGSVVDNAGTVNVTDGNVPDSDDVMFSQPGTYYWQAAYSGDEKNKEVTSDCETEILEIAAQVAKITPTGTTCQQYAGSTAATLGLVTYTMKGGLINASSPGVFFYYAKVSGGAGDTVMITQSYTGNAPPIPILNSQVVLYSMSCSKLAWYQLTVNPDGTAAGMLPYAGSFIVGVKYSPSSLKGKTPPSPTTSTYTYDTKLNGSPIASDIARIDLVKR